MSQGFDLSFSLSFAGFPRRRSVPSFVSWEHKLSIAERWQTSRKVFWRLVEVHHNWQWRQCWHWRFAWLQATGGEGVDVVLNSLSGKAIPASLNLCLSIIKVIKPHISRHFWYLIAGIYVLSRVSQGFATLGGSWKLANGISMKERKWNWHLSSKAGERAGTWSSEFVCFPLASFLVDQASHTTRRTSMCWCSRDPTSAEGSWKRRMGLGKGKILLSSRIQPALVAVFIRFVGFEWGLGRAAESSSLADKDFWDGKSERPGFRKSSNKKANQICFFLGRVQSCLLDCNEEQVENGIGMDRLACQICLCKVP